MKILKWMFIGASFMLVSVALYQWGHQNGRTGKTVSLLPAAYAAQDKLLVSPVLCEFLNLHCKG